MNHQPHVVIIGGGFGGLYAAKALKRTPARVTLIDKRNFHLFQPLLYQVATGGLSPGDIASPLRGILSRHKNVQVIKAEAIDIDPAEQKVILRDGELRYDILVVAAGVSHHYFGHEEWADVAPGLKTVEDATAMRRRILLAFEAAERETDPARRRAWMRFVVVGGGPTGVELAGALAELAHTTMKNDFREIDPAEVEILLLEGMERILPPYPPELSARAEQSLARLGVTVLPRTQVIGISEEAVTVRREGLEEQLPARTVLWAAGVQASPLGQILARRTGAKLDRAGRVMVEPDLSVAGYPNLFVIGDLAHVAHQGENPLPGIAPVAIQQGQYVAGAIQRRLQGVESPPFHYRDKGSMAVIGRNAAVAVLGGFKVAGFPAWLAWVFIHLWYLIGFDSKLMVMFQWGWNYFTRKVGARLITGEKSFVLVEGEQPELTPLPYVSDLAMGYRPALNGKHAATPLVATDKPPA